MWDLKEPQGSKRCYVLGFFCLTYEKYLQRKTPTTIQCIAVHYSSRIDAHISL